MTRQIFIAVIGVTGAGKTTFISKATGRTDLDIGHSLESCTKDIEEFRCRVDGKEIVLLDTPGFDDTYDSDADILERIAEYLHSSYQSGTLLSGMILLQPINVNRLTLSERKRTRLFKKVLGENAYHRVIIGTTMWDNMVNEEQGNRNRNERKTRDDVWGDMTALGARVIDHRDTTESAHNIIRQIISSNTRVELRLQQELSGNGNLYETSAGKQLDEDLGDMINYLRRELAKLRNDNDVTAEELRQAQERIEKFENRRRRFRRKIIRAVSSRPQPLGNICQRRPMLTTSIVSFMLRNVKLDHC